MFVRAKTTHRLGHSDQEPQGQHLRDRMDEPTTHRDDPPDAHGAGEEEGWGDLGQDEPGGDLHPHVSDKEEEDGVVVIQVTEFQVFGHPGDFGVGDVVTVEDVEL